MFWSRQPGRQTTHQNKFGNPEMPLDPDRVRKPARKLRKLLRRVPKQPTPELVHDLRTNTRRLEAVLSALALDSRRNDRKLLKVLSQVRKRAGKVRDMDVLTAFAAGVRPQGEEECSVQLLEQLGAKRRSASKKLHDVVAKNGQVARSRLKTTLAELDEKVPKEVDNASGSNNARSQATATALRLESELASVKSLTRNNLHPYRLTVKNLQNVLRMAENSGSKDFLDALGRVKDAIGEWHDWEELLAIAPEVLNHGRKCELLRELKRISDEKYVSALRETENMRKRFLRISQRRARRGVKSPSQPVWSATSAIAA
jgi:CHAD domain-containing protein